MLGASNTAVFNTVSAAANALEEFHIMAHHKKPPIDQIAAQEIQETALLADASEEILGTSAYSQCSLNDCTDFTLWFFPFNNYLRQSSENGIPSFTNEIAGTILALHYKGIRDAVFGGGFAYAFNYTHYSQSLGHAKINQEMGVIYGSGQFGRVFFNGTLWGGIYQLKNVRHTNPFPITSTLKADGWTLTPHFELGVYLNTEKLVRRRSFCYGGLGQ